MIYSIDRDTCNITPVEELAQLRRRKEWCISLTTLGSPLGIVQVVCRVNDFQMIRLGVVGSELHSSQVTVCAHVSTRITQLPTIAYDASTLMKIDEDGSGCCCVGPAH
jgi:hypothetical protein